MSTNLALEALEELRAVFKRHGGMEDHELDVLALWTMHTYLLPVIQHSPRLLLWSATHGSGKSTVLDMLELLAFNPTLTSSPTTSTVFRMLDAERITLLLDEADKWMYRDLDMTGAINAGHKRNGTFMRSEKDADGNWVPRKFKVWGAVALAAKNKLPATDLLSRAIKITMQKAHKGSVQPFAESEHGEGMKTLQKQVAKAGAWAVMAAKKGKPPTWPSWMNDGRMWDNWKPLYTIAGVAGGRWPERVERAALLMSNVPLRDRDLGERLLWDICAIYKKLGFERAHTLTLLTHLNENLEAPWKTKFNRGAGLNEYDLSDMLGKFGIRPEKNPFRNGHTLKRGYAKAAFEDAWQRYSVTPEGPETRSTEGDDLWT